MNPFDWTLVGVLVVTLISWLGFALAQAARLADARTEKTILRLLYAADEELYRELHGLDLVERSRGALFRGTIYISLARLEEEGLVESREETDQKHTGFPRRLYRITARGRVVYESWRSP